ncbi:MAG: hypothetical protein AUG02_05805 [Chloroflexi bacterium 13_1_20CM_2_70_9]|nr:MAG: hypothetical protein AUG02_05805 [Chloroflexi bacterium 13_1_20CM_2_70_9]
MRRYVEAARRYWWILALILALEWGVGLVAAYVEYKTTFESEAIVWAQRPPPQLAATPEDPNATVAQTAASQHVALLNQLLLTDSFLRDVIARTSLRASLEKAPDERKALDEFRRHFHVQALGTNLLSASFVGHDPRIAYEALAAALTVRGERVAQARVAATSAIGTLYRKELELTQAQALDAQRELEEFNASHPRTLSDLEQHRQDQLRLALDFVQIRLGDLRGRIDQAVLAPALLDLSGMEFQVIDEPREETSPRGGTKAAASLASVAFGAGIALAALLILLGGFFADRVAGTASVVKLAPATLFATVPHVVAADGGRRRDLRSDLAVIAFGDTQARSRAADR